jgi:transcription antitermination factor NusG
MESVAKKWYVFKVTSRHEKKVANQLEKKNIEYFLPLNPKKRNWSDRIKIVDFPLFPGYIFIKIDWALEKNTVFTASGIYGFIMRNEKPAVMSDEDIEMIASLVRSSRELTVASDENFPVGTEVVMEQGPLKGVKGVVEGIKNKKRIYVRIPLLGQMIIVEADVLDIEKIY